MKEIKEEGNMSKTVSLYALASGKPGKEFTKKEFIRKTNTGEVNPATKNGKSIPITLKDGYVYLCGSKDERTFLRKIADSCKCIRGQCLPISYRFESKTHKYFPDLIILTKTNKIIIIEIKQISEMVSKLNRRKYNALRAYCNRHGYLYMMCDRKFNAFDKLGKDTRMPTVEALIEESIKRKGNFNYKDYKELIKGKKKNRVNAIRDAIGTFVKVNEKRYKVIGDLTHQITSFRIKKKRK